MAKRKENMKDCLWRHRKDEACKETPQEALCP